LFVFPLLPNIFHSEIKHCKADTRKDLTTDLRRLAKKLGFLSVTQTTRVLFSTVTVLMQKIISLTSSYIQKYHIESRNVEEEKADIELCTSAMLH